MTRAPRIALLYTRLRAEEKLLIEAAEAREIELIPQWDEQLTADVHRPPAWAEDVDAVLVRTLSLNRALSLTAWLERHGLPTVNSHRVLQTCGDKWLTSLALAEAGVPTPATVLATDREAALQASQDLGFPVVTKPLQGSWARMVHRLSDADALEAVVEQREVLGHPLHHQHYLQAHVDKPGRDIRAFLAGDEVLCAIYRTSDHWVTNTARGATATDCPVTPELEERCLAAANALGGGVLAVDLMEDPQAGLLVHEVNATMEFRNSIEPTGTDIPARILDHVTRQAEVLA